MYAPHVFHGTSGDVTVPESSTARLSTCGASPLRRNSSRYIRAGRTSATYWSPAVTLRPIPLEFTASMRLPRDLARVTIGRSSRSRKPACSRIAANAIAASTSQTVVSRLAIPPREKKLVDRLDPAYAHEAGRHRRIYGVDRGRERSLGRVVDERLDGRPLSEAREDAGEQRRSP